MSRRSSKSTRSKSSSDSLSSSQSSVEVSSAPSDVIQVRGVHQNNLKGFNLDIPLYKLNVVTGPSGSGKSSLAFDTIYAEGQRRYVETFSPYTRQFFERMDKPQVEAIHDIPPAIAIEQVNNIRSTRSTVGTITELNDYLKMLFPRIASAKCPSCNRIVQPDTPESILKDLFRKHSSSTALVTFHIPVPKDTNTADFFSFLQSQGYALVLLFGEIIRTDEPDTFKKKLPTQVPVIQDRIQIDPKNKARLIEALETALNFGKGTVSLALLPSQSHNGDLGANLFTKSYSTDWRCADCDLKLPAPTPGLFSFNNPVGACPKCRGFGRTLALDISKAIPDESLSVNEGLIKAFSGDTYAECQDDLIRCAKLRGIDIDLPFEDYSEEDRQWLIEGDRSDPEEAYNNGEWYGVRGFFKWLEARAYKMHIRVFLSRYRAYTECPDCLGSRLKIEASFFRLNGKTLHDLWLMPVGELLPFFQNLNIPENDKAARLLCDEIISRLSYMERAGLSYLNLDRQTRTLSGGELQRVNLTTCLGASLVNTLFVLDEPSIGLHSRDIGKLIGIMEGLRDKGNTLLVVEHEESVMRAADNLIEIGPGRGEHGGQLVFNGPLEKLSSNKGTLTGDYLFGRKFIPVPSSRRKPKANQQIRINGARQNNLKKLNVNIPLNLFVAVTGVSGSGKSTLIHDVLYNNLLQQRGESTDDEPGKVKSITGADKVGQIIMVDQSPLARTPRSTPAVYIGAFDLIRQLFAETPAAKADELTPGFFSFNSGNGRCERCMGNGFEKIEMQFLSDLYVSCPECEGKRYQPHALKYTLDGKSIHDVLSMTIEDAIAFFETMNSKKAQNILIPLKLLQEAGLSYIRLGQPLNTLSGGEAQRLKLIGHLLEPSSDHDRKTLFLLDEPTTGLHFDDIALLIKLLQRLVNEGHSLIVIEHNLEVIKCADWIIDLGPEAGTAGGELVAEGPPEVVVKNKRSWTGKFLSEVLNPDHKLNESASTYLANRISAAKQDRSFKLALEPSIPNAISVRGAREHNLKSLNLDIPRDQLVVVTGLSGSGKSSLAFDLIFAEGQRRFLDSMSVYARTFVEQMEKPDVDLIAGVPPTVAIEQRVSRGSGKSTVATVTEIYHFLRLLYSKVGVQHCPNCHIPVEKQSVNAIVQLTAKHARKTQLEIISPLIKARKGFHTDVAEAAAKQGIATLLVDGEYQSTSGFQKLARFKEHTIDAVVAKIAKNASADNIRPHVERALKLGKGVLKLLLPDQTLHVLNTDMSCPQCNMSFEELDPRLFSFNSPHGWCQKCRGFGVIAQHIGRDNRRDDISLLEAELEEERKFDSSEHSTEPCPSCEGSRLNPIARAVKVHDIPVADITKLSAERAAEVINQLTFSGTQETITRDIMVEIKQRLHFMQQVGLGYLQLGRSADTLSGGEAQRIRLASQLGSNLRGVLYVLDEPTIGLHPRDNRRLLNTLLALRDKGNSLLVVEHDEDTMRNADTILDLGPGAGRFGGELIAQGNLGQILKHPNSTTGQALRQPMRHPLHGKRRPLPKKNDPNGWLTLKNAQQNNLKNLTLNLPIGRLTVITGVSGSGKSTLMRSALYPAVKSALSKSSKKNPKLIGAQHLAAVYEVDQSPIGKTSRSCPATYVGVLDDIRKLFAQLPTSRARGFGPGRFSFNTEGGRCETCQGNGEIKVEMNFLPSTRVHCDTCNGMRFNAATMEVTYNGKNIGEVLKMSITEAAEFFASIPKIARPLQLLADTGVGYLQLGQPSPTLSGGESQRLKLVTELQAGQGRTITDKMRGLKNTKRNLYLIEEPTIGLHAHDVVKLIDILHRLVDDGHTVVVIEHEINVIAEADHIVDIGPEAGERGGQIVAEGPPEKVAQSKVSHTAPFLREILGMK